MTLYESGEMYLETIYILSQQSSAVCSIDVGEYMGFSKPSVSRAVGLLRKADLIRIDESGFIARFEPTTDMREVRAAVADAVKQ